ncbi:Six-hairpin glycosidase [Lindgomyces ingoldianus]|uniref:Six-hairpin glycosidase n=1 Tax=Lindgomyces ingoldianus TaxID=673940 RepID=A0ACB6QLM1_9PLEO|nr:Six-hairpin glycosidase [Lindgomyces ingoldianus]KAF2467425.1 Six-hairpin glycosidase [Lindgomyces ingoldianus]
MVSPTLINTVLAKAIEVATHSWEYGTVSEAILEWRNASLSIWDHPFPNNNIPTLNLDKVPALTYVKPFIRTDNVTLVDGDGAAGDPASLGIPALLIGKSQPSYYSAAIRQANHLLTAVPRWSNGAISHREAYPELWADFIYMVPPFLAYYGVASNDVGLLKAAANQCKLYRDVLVTNSGLWLHIVGNHTKDLALWSTGNGWAAAGMSRVLAAMKNSQYSHQTAAEQTLLEDMVKAILNGAIKLDVDESGLLRNYLDNATWFGEISGTSILAATAFRMAILSPGKFGKAYTDWAKKKMDVVDGKIDKGTGIVAPAINPLNWHDMTPYTSGSPEGQSFVVLLHAAYRDWEEAKKSKRN